MLSFLIAIKIKSKPILDLTLRAWHVALVKCKLIIDRELQIHTSCRFFSKHVRLHFELCLLGSTPLIYNQHHSIPGYTILSLLDSLSSNFLHTGLHWV